MRTTALIAGVVVYFVLNHLNVAIEDNNLKYRQGRIDAFMIKSH